MCQTEVLQNTTDDAGTRHRPTDKSGNNTTTPGRAISSSILVALGTLASAQSKATTSTMADFTQLMDNLATHPKAIIRYQASAMILAMHRDASNLSETESRSRARGIVFISSASISPKINGAIHVHSSIIKMVLASAVEAEVDALFFNAQEA
jgi:hypothetical protein